jgi:hypothetical protein
MTSSSPPHISIWEGRRHAISAQARSSQAFPPGLAFLRAIVAEFRRAAAAADRYEQLKRVSRAGDDPAGIARRIYMEFYFDG